MIALPTDGTFVSNGPLSSSSKDVHQFVVGIERLISRPDMNCHAAGGELEQIQLLLGHRSVETTERYLGSRQRLVSAVNDKIGLEPDLGHRRSCRQADFAGTTRQVDEHKRVFYKEICQGHDWLALDGERIVILAIPTIAFRKSGEREDYAQGTVN